MLARSSGEISVPIDTSAAAFRPASTSSVRMPLKSSPAAQSRVPMNFMDLAYATLSATTLVISGKCQPYHSRTRIAYVLSSLSSSSSRPMACAGVVGGRGL